VDAQPTVVPRGLLRGGPLADGFELRRTLGRDPAAFERARAALRSLAPQRSISEVAPVEARVEVGATVVAALGIGPVHVLAIDRIVEVVDEPDRYGFAYVTLPGHVLRGEEAFLLERTDDGSVVGSVRGWADLAVPAGRLLRTPLRLAERIAADRYLDALARAARP
jgi:uncharacterized protein (UPF0548 family)